MFNIVKHILNIPDLKINDLYAAFKQFILDGLFYPNYILPVEHIDINGYNNLIRFLKEDINNLTLFKHYCTCSNNGRLKNAKLVIRDKEMKDASDECLRNLEVYFNNHTVNY